MHLQEGRAGGGSSSPLGPDSTWTDSEMTGHKMEARFAQMEARILKEQDEKFNKMLEAIMNIPQKPAPDASDANEEMLNEKSKGRGSVFRYRKEKLRKCQYHALQYVKSES